jgi:ferric-dicitrate binding protein FerR (iron transport regulator)
MVGIQLNKERYIINEAWIEITAPAWTRAKFSLPDGTTGWLNSNSSLKYNMDFNKTRQISLNGEAYFDVYRDNKRTFLVNTGDINVKVLGTKFNIASYENENNVEVVLEEGKIQFFDKMMQKSYTMNPNNLLVYDKNILDFTVTSVEPQKYSSWTEGKLVFRNDPLDVIARRLERWYNIDIEIDGSIDQGPRLRATFLDETLEEVLGLLSRSLQIDYRIEDRILESDETYAKKKIIMTVKPNKPKH